MEEYTVVSLSTTAPASNRHYSHINCNNNILCYGAGRTAATNDSGITDFGVLFPIAGESELRTGRMHPQWMRRTAADVEGFVTENSGTPLDFELEKKLVNWFSLLFEVLSRT